MVSRADRASAVWAAVRALAYDGEVAERMAELSRATQLPPGQIKALLRLDHEDFASMREFARRALGCDPSYVTGLVDELTDRGLAERRPSPDDRRVKTIVLTDAGRALAARIQAALAVPPAALDALGTDQLTQLEALLRAVVDAAEPASKATAAAG